MKTSHLFPKHTSLRNTCPNTICRYSYHSLPLGRLIIALCCVVSLVVLPLQPALAFKTTMEYYHYNHQGSLLEVYDGNTNKRVLSQAWSPWGERQVLHSRASGNSVGSLLAHGLPVHMGYTGHKELLSTGLIFAGDTRLYDARLKRFLNSDDRTTGGVRGQNRYSYAYNNPMTYIDSDGRAPRLSTRAGIHNRRPLLQPRAKARASLLRTNADSALQTKFNGVVVPRKIVRHLLPNPSAHDHTKAAMWASGLSGVALSSYGMLRGSPLAIGMGGLLMASPGRTLAAINNGAINNPWRNAAYVFGSNLAAGTPGYIYTGMRNGAAAAAIAIAGAIVLSSSIYMADRRFIAKSDSASGAHSLLSIPNVLAQKTLLRRQLIYVPTILSYAAVVGGGAFSSNLVLGNSLAKSIHNALLTMVFPTSFLLQAFNLRQPTEHNSSPIRNRFFFESRYMIGAWSTVTGLSINYGITPW